MFTVEVTIDLPFFLRLEGSFTVRYEEVCRESQLPDLLGQDVQITFSRRTAGTIDKSGWPMKERTTVAIEVEAPRKPSDGSVSTFAIRNCLEMVNRVIASYQATTGEVTNAGFIFPLGTSDMQLFADIRVNGQDIRDRWPSHSINTFPLPNGKISEFKRYLTGQQGLPLSRLFLTSAILSLERGQYPLAVLQAATAVELRITQYVVGELKAAAWKDKKIKEYEDKTLGPKLRFAQPDLRSLETHFGNVANFSSLHSQLRCWFTQLRNDVIHHGYLACRQEAKRAVEMAGELLKVVN